MKQKSRFRWLLISLAAVVVAAPNAAIVKYALGSISPEFFNVLRFGVLSLAITPYVIRHRSTLTKKALRYVLLAGIYMSLAVISFVGALNNGPASYVSILSLMIPITFIFYAAKLTGENISRRSVAGITLAALGAFTVVGLPIALHQQANFTFYPLATLLILVNVLSYPLAIIYLKKAHVGAISLPMLLGISSYIVFLVSLGFWLLSGAVMPAEFKSLGLLGAVYSGLIVALVSRILAVASYEKLGAAVSGGLSYLESFLAILFPLILLGERLSIETVLGGVLILAGVYVLEHHESSHHKHLHFFRHH